MKEDNTLAVVKKAVRFNKIPVTNQSIEEEIITHPDYPSFKCITDSFDKWGIPYHAVKLTVNELMEWPSSFIAHINKDGGKLVFVQNIGSNNTLKYFDEHSENIEDDKAAFIRDCSGGVILIEPKTYSGDKRSKHKIYKKNHFKILLTFAILSLLFFALSQPSLLYTSWSSTKLMLFVTKLSGLVISLIIVFKEFGFNNALVDKFCKVNEKADCNEVLLGKGAFVYSSVKWSSLGVIYFLSGLLLVVNDITPSTISLFALLAVMPICYVLFSLYYQAFVAKKWCPLCLIILLIFTVEFFVLCVHLNLQLIELQSVIHFASVFTLVTFLILMLRENMDKQQLLKEKHLSLLKIKKDPLVFQALLKKNCNTNLNSVKKGFQFGSEQAPIKLTVFLSLHCEHCRAIFNQLVLLVQNHPVSINLLFVLRTNDEPVIMALDNSLKKDSKASIEFLSRYFKNKNTFKKAKGTNNKDFSTIAVHHNEQFVQAQIKTIPSIFINDCLLPRHYQISEIEYFIEYFKEIKTATKMA